MQSASFVHPRISQLQGFVGTPKRLPGGILRLIGPTCIVDTRADPDTSVVDELIIQRGGTRIDLALGQTSILIPVSRVVSNYSYRAA